MFHIIHAAKVSQYSSISNYIAQFRPPKSKLRFFHSSINFFTGGFLQCLYLIVAFSPWHNRMTLDYFYGQAGELFSFFRILSRLKVEEANEQLRAAMNNWEQFLFSRPIRHQDPHGTIVWVLVLPWKKPRRRTSAYRYTSEGMYEKEETHLWGVVLSLWNRSGKDAIWIFLALQILYRGKHHAHHDYGLLYCGRGFSSNSHCSMGKSMGLPFRAS